jgi:hypothetical protein
MVPDTPNLESAGEAWLRPAVYPLWRAVRLRGGFETLAIGSTAAALAFLAGITLKDLVE